MQRLENAIGWYHSHPGYGCWLSGIDVDTQMNNQKFTDPFVAVVVSALPTVLSKYPLTSLVFALPSACTTSLATFLCTRSTQTAPFLPVVSISVPSAHILKATPLHPRPEGVATSINPFLFQKSKTSVYTRTNTTHWTCRSSRAV